MALEVFKEKYKKITWKQGKKTKSFLFQPILDCFITLESLEKLIFKKLSIFHRLIDLLWIFRRFLWFLREKVVSSNFKSSIPVGGVEWFSFFEKFINPGVLEVAHDHENKAFVLELSIILRYSARKWENWKFWKKKS
jgi:hypothetical protein